MLDADQGELSQLLNDVYDAVLDNELWPKALDGVRRLTDSADCALLGVEPHLGSRLFAFTASGEPITDYQTKFADKDEIAERMGNLYSEGVLIRSHLEISDAELLHTDIYNQWWKRRGVFYTAGYFLSKWQRGWAGFWVSRPKKEGPYVDRDVEVLRFLLPHLTRAFKISSLLSQEAPFSLGARGSVHLGGALYLESKRAVFILDDKGRVKEMNVSAREFLDRSGIHLLEGRLKTDKLTSLPRFVEYVSLAKHPSMTAEGIRFYRVQRDALLPCWVVVAPLERIAGAADLANSGSTLMMVLDPETDRAELRSFLIDLYGLTSAEANVALAAAFGGSISDVGGLLGIGQETVKTHLKRIYFKTGAKGQADLSSLLLSGPVGLLAPKFRPKAPPPAMAGEAMAVK